MRDAAFALEHGADDLPLRFKLWFGKAFDLARDIASFPASTIISKKRELEIQPEDLLTTPTRCDLALPLRAKIGRARIYPNLGIRSSCDAYTGNCEIGDEDEPPLTAP
jgi:transposase